MGPLLDQLEARASDPRHQRDLVTYVRRWMTASEAGRRDPNGQAAANTAAIARIVGHEIACDLADLLITINSCEDDDEDSVYMSVDLALWVVENLRHPAVGMMVRTSLRHPADRDAFTYVLTRAGAPCE